MKIISPLIPDGFEKTGYVIITPAYYDALKAIERAARIESDTLIKLALENYDKAPQYPFVTGSSRVQERTNE